MNPLYNNQTDKIIEDIKRQAIELRKSLPQDPKQIVQAMLNDGRISQQQFNQVFPFAQSIASKMGKFRL